METASIEDNTSEWYEGVEPEIDYNEMNRTNNIRYANTVRKF